MTANQRKTHLELIRLAAIFLVIWNHTRANGFGLYLSSDGITLAAGYFLSVYCKIAVPLFLMVSGALLIPKREGIKELFKKRILRIILVIVVFTLLQYLRICLAQNTAPSVGVYAALCWSGNVIEPYWYLRLYLGYLLFLPFLRALARELDRAEGYGYLLIMGAAKVVVDVIAILTGYAANVTFLACTNFLFYPLLGHALESGRIALPPFLGRRRGLWAFAASLFVAAVTSACGIAFRCVTGSFSDEFLSISVFPMAALAFVAAMGAGDASGAAGTVLSELGGCVFGTYLIEDVVRNVIEFRIGWSWGFPSPFISSILFAAAATAAALLIVWPIRRLPIVRKFI